MPQPGPLSAIAMTKGATGALIFAFLEPVTLAQNFDHCERGGVYSGLVFGIVDDSRLGDTCDPNGPRPNRPLAEKQRLRVPRCERGILRVLVLRREPRRVRQ